MVRTLKIDAQLLLSISCVFFAIILFYINDLVLPILVPGYRSEYAKECLLSFSLCSVLNIAFYITLTAFIVEIIRGRTRGIWEAAQRREYKSIAFITVLLILTSIHVSYLMGEPLNRTLAEIFMMGVALAIIYIIMYFVQMPTVDDEHI